MRSGTIPTSIQDVPASGRWYVTNGANAVGPIDLDLIPQVTLRVRVPGEEGEPDLASTTLLLDKTKPEAIFRHRFPMAFTTARLFVRPEWLDAQGQVHTGPTQEVRGDLYVALGPFVASLHLRVVPAADWESVTQIAVQVRYRDGDHTFNKDLVFVPSGGRAVQEVEIPLLDAKNRTYEWTQTVLRLDGTVSQEEWTESTKSILVVGASKKTSGDVRIVLVGAPPETAGVRVDLWAVDANGEEQSAAVFLIPGSATEKVASLPLDTEGRLSYRYEVRRISAEGEELVKLGEGESALLVVNGGG